MNDMFTSDPSCFSGPYSCTVTPHTLHTTHYTTVHYTTLHYTHRLTDGQTHKQMCIHSHTQCFIQTFVQGRGKKFLELFGVGGGGAGGISNVTSAELHGSAVWSMFIYFLKIPRGTLKIQRGHLPLPTPLNETLTHRYTHGRGGHTHAHTRTCTHTHTHARTHTHTHTHNTHTHTHTHTQANVFTYK